MGLWCKKWFLALAGIILLAHNLTPHHHHEVDVHEAAMPGAHHHDNDDGDESDGFARHHSIDHAFVTAHSFDYFLLPAVGPAILPALVEGIGRPVFSCAVLFLLPADESPPGLLAIRRLSYRGPPSC